MKLVVDSNIIFSAIISPTGKTAELLLLEDIELYSARTLEIELLGHKKEIMRKAHFREEQFELLMLIFLGKITFLENAELYTVIGDAKKICPDVGDIAFFAVCLAKNLPLWSNDKKLKQQKVVKVISTEELAKEIE